MTERAELEKAIAALEAQRAILGDAVVDAMITAAREKLALLKMQPAVEQRKQVTVLFADVSGFTAMAETMDPEEVHSTIDSLWKKIDAVIAAHEGTVDKHIGDAVMAIFGAPTAQEDDPERAIQAALAMQEVIGDWRSEIEETSMLYAPMPDIQIRVGVNTGPVLLGTVGIRAEYTAIGDTVNVARRLQDAAPVGGILISHDTYRHVRGVFDVEPREPITLKGKAEPVQTYVVQAAKPRAFHLIYRGIEGLETRMIGRDSELEHLQTLLRKVIETGAAQVVTISGEAGVGKSRLLYEFTNWIELLPESVRFFKGRTDPRMSQLPYALIRDFFAFRFAIQEGDPASVAREKLERGIVEFMGPDGLEKAHFIGHLIGFDFSTSSHLRGILDDTRQIRDRAFHYTAQFFQTVTAEQPAVLFLEDIHWADSSALDLIDHLAKECRNFPLMIVALTRPQLFEQRSAWGQEWPHHVHLALRPLPEEDSRQLVTEILRKVPEVPTKLQEFIVSRAGGNPFFIEELIKVLIEDAIIVKERAQWQVRAERLAEAGIPQTLTGVLQARLDRLSPVERETVQQASVVGRIFWEGAVAYLGQKNRSSVRAVLHKLREKDWLYARKDSTFAGEHEFVFKHTLLHEVTYESVLRRQRRAYHGQVAEWLIERSGERAEEYAGLVGEHYDRAGKEILASEWFGRAGKQAKDTYAPEAAIHYYLQALGLLPQTTVAIHAMRRITLYEGLGDELGRLGRYAAAAEAYAAMQAAAQAVGDAVAHARSWERLASVQDSQGDYHAALKSAERAEEMAREANAPVVLMGALRRKGLAYLELGDPEKAALLGEQALALSTEMDVQREMAKSLNLLGAIYWNLGKHEQAAHCMGEALSIYWGLDDRQGVGVTLNDLAATAQMRGDYHKAVTLYQDAMVLFEEIGYREGEVVCRSNLGGVRVKLEEYGAAEVDLRQVIEQAEVGSWFLAETYRFLAEACLGQGQVEEALKTARRALALGKETGHQEFIAGAWRTLGLVAAQLDEAIVIGETVDQFAQQGDTRTYGPAACFAESLSIYQETGMEAEQARTLREWARYELEQGDKARGEEMWQEAREIFERLGMVAEVERVDSAHQKYSSARS